MMRYWIQILILAHTIESFGFHRSLFIHRIHTENLGDDDNYPNVQEGNVNQILDHFTPNSATFNQRYFYNQQYNKANSVSFLNLGGSGGIYKNVIGNESLPLLQTANDAGALIFSLEHRFFGKSLPNNGLTPDNLQYLTTRQVLEDIANFIQQMNVLFKLDNPRWVVFGGSYSGSLSAWFRSKYPSLTVGAVASSAPLDLKIDFYDYANVVQDDLKWKAPACSQATGDAFAQMLELSKTEEGRATLSQKLKLSPPFDSTANDQDVGFMFNTIYSSFQEMTQFSYTSMNEASKYNITITKTCEIMTDATVDDPIVRVSNLNDWAWKSYGGLPHNNYTAMIKGIDDVDKAWYWLCCNELGWLQTNDQSENIFNNTVPLKFFTGFCSDLFGLTSDVLQTNNKASQDYYGGVNNYKATNIIMPHGSLDPWYPLVLQTGQDANNVQVYVIEEATHMSETFAAYLDEPPAVGPARDMVRTKVLEYIASPPVPTTVPVSTATSAGSNPTTVRASATTGSVEATTKTSCYAHFNSLFVVLFVYLLC